MRVVTVLKGRGFQRVGTGKNKSGFSRWGEPFGSILWG